MEKHDLAHHTEAEVYRREPHVQNAMCQLGGTPEPLGGGGLGPEHGLRYPRGMVPRHSCYGVLGRRGKQALSNQPVTNRKNRRKTRSYCGPSAPSALLIDQTQKQSWIIETGLQATFYEAGLPEPDPRRHEPQNGGDGGKGFRKRFDCQFHARFPAWAVAAFTERKTTGRPPQPR